MRMNNKLMLIFSFIVGVSVGVISTEKYFKDKYERLADEDFNSRRFNNSKTSESQDETSNNKESYEADIMKSKTILHREGYVNYNEVSSGNENITEEADKPYVIHPSDFGEFEDYEKISLVYTSDGVLLDDNGEIVNELENTVGVDSLNHFGEFEEDSVYVRNDSRKCDYEILADEDPYYVETES